MLKVININSKVDLTKHECAFVEQVIEIAEEIPGWDEKYSISTILDNIPVFLLRPEDMPDKLSNHRDNYENSNEEGNLKGISFPAIEYFGFYTRLDQHAEYINNIPAVFICPERILGFDPKNYNLIVALAIIHEFAHAKMDQSALHLKHSVSVELSDWIEEPLANWFVLRYFCSFGHGDVFGDVEMFIRNSPINYRLAWDLFIDYNPEEIWQKLIELKSNPTNSSNNDGLLKPIVGKPNVEHKIIENIHEILGLKTKKLPDSNKPSFIKGQHPMDAMQIGLIRPLKDILAKNQFKWVYQRSDVVPKLIGNIDLRNNDLQEIPEIFSSFEIIGNFWCDGNKLKNLKNAPKKITGSFSCSGNNIQTLDDKPDICGNFWVK